MPWIRYTGPCDRVHVPRWGILTGPDGEPGVPRLAPVEVSAEAAVDLDGHPEWEPADAPAPESEV